MPKRIIVLSDGTGNAAASIWRTNVWRTFKALELKGHDQVAYYDDGIGTSRFKPLALIGGAFGYGLQRNVIECYKFLCRNYEPGAEIYGFGFSRGAFTIRVVMRFALERGLVRYDNNEAQLHRDALAAYRDFRDYNNFGGGSIKLLFRIFRKLFNKSRPHIPHHHITVRFIGVWDTVGAYVLPIAALARFVNRFIWPVEIYDNTLHSRIKRACHALAIDEERQTFAPILWDERKEPAKSKHTYNERLSQVWFPGVHANVGGGYPDDALAHVPLVWILREAERCGLRFKTFPLNELDVLEGNSDMDGRMYNSRSGFGTLYRYDPRRIVNLCNYSDRDISISIPVPKLHVSVLARTHSSAHAYAPIGLPTKYSVVTDDGKIHQANKYEGNKELIARARAQELVWDYVHYRRWAYLGILFFLFYLAIFPLIFSETKEGAVGYIFYVVHKPIEFMVSWSIGLLDSFPSWHHDWWLRSYLLNPFKFAVGVVGLLVCLTVNKRLGVSISDRMRSVWKTGYRERHRPQTLLSKLRSNSAAIRTGRFLTTKLLPLLAVGAALFVVAVVVTRLAFSFSNVAGLSCSHGRVNLDNLRLGEGHDEASRVTISASSGCFLTATILTKGQRYRVRVYRNSESSYTVAPFTYFTKDKPYADPILLAPFKRVATRPLRRLIARVGNENGTDISLDPPRAELASEYNYAATFEAPFSGELYLYVNNYFSGFPFLQGLLYGFDGDYLHVEIQSEQ